MLLLSKTLFTRKLLDAFKILYCCFRLRGNLHFLNSPFSPKKSFITSTTVLPPFHSVGNVIKLFLAEIWKIQISPKAKTTRIGYLKSNKRFKQSIVLLENSIVFTFLCRFIFPLKPKLQDYAILKAINSVKVLFCFIILLFSHLSAGSAIRTNFFNFLIFGEIQISSKKGFITSTTGFITSTTGPLPFRLHFCTLRFIKFLIYAIEGRTDDGVLN